MLHAGGQIRVTAKKKAKSAKVIYRANGSQLRYLKRNLQHIDNMLLVNEERDVPLR
jgi:hypothetical protein